ncbi:hypothetical protein NSS64_06210 [Paenibacillus sp. FSL H8-0122]|uniref:hypothetical protein n=1 Tax=Paenibacillus sp. FSL H8-0122 TaxID=2954510 RepID=UPI0030F51904
MLLWKIIFACFSAVCTFIATLMGLGDVIGNYTSGWVIETVRVIYGSDRRRSYRFNRDDWTVTSYGYNVR